mgnify:FL=1
MKQDKIKIENGRLAIILREILGGKNLINEDKEFDEEYKYFSKEELDNITELDLRWKKVGNIEDIVKLPNLKRLVISSEKLNRVPKIETKRAEKEQQELKEYIDNRVTGIEDFKPIENLKGLESLEIYNEEKLVKLDTSKLINLKILKIDNDPNLKEISGIDKNLNLETLRIERVGTREFRFKRI